MRELCPPGQVGMLAAAGLEPADLVGAVPGHGGEQFAAAGAPESAPGSGGWACAAMPGRCDQASAVRAPGATRHAGLHKSAPTRIEARPAVYSAPYRAGMAQAMDG